MVHPHHLQNPYIVHSPQYKYILILPSVNPAGFVGKINLNKINGSQHDTWVMHDLPYILCDEQCF